LKKSAVKMSVSDKEILKTFLSMLTEEQKEEIRKGLCQMETKYA